MIATLIAAIQILGTWQYAGFRYLDKDYPNPNPDLELRFTFNDKGQSILTYRRANDGEYCERLASYTFDGVWLYQKVIWVNPKNTVGCGRDQDMQLGRESTTEVSMRGQQLAFHLELDGIELLYLMNAVSAGSIDSAGR